MMRSHDTIDDALATWLRMGSMPEGLAEMPRGHLLLCVDLHGLGPTLARMAEEAPKELADALRERLIAREFWEAQHIRLLEGALGALCEVGLTPLVFKGTALALSAYLSAAERMRGDSDVLVELEGRETAVAALEAAGFTAMHAAGGEVLVGEALMQKADPTGTPHDLDLHWRFSNSVFLSRLFTHAELIARAVSLRVGSVQAYRPSDIDALLIACVHRRLHIDGTGRTALNGVTHETPDSLTWIRDLDLLARRLGTEDWARFWQAAEAKGIAEICARGLLDARDRFDTPLPADEVEARAARLDGHVEAYLHRTPLRRLATDLTAAPGPRAKLRFLVDLGLPPADYMRARFGRDGRSWLPWLYLKRAAGGLHTAYRRGRARR